MAVARIPEPGDAVEVAAVGNIAIHVTGPRGSWRTSGSSFVVGAPGDPRKPMTHERALDPRDVLILFTDGLTTRTDLQGELDLLREHPIIIAHQLVERFGRDNDDALVLVVR